MNYVSVWSVLPVKSKFKIAYTTSLSYNTGGTEGLFSSSEKKKQLFDMLYIVGINITIITIIMN